MLGQALVVSANNDTLYSTTFADLRAEPVMLTIPPTGGRYFVVQLVDMGTDNFAYLGTRASGRDGGTFVLVGPTFKGALPTGHFDRVIASPSKFVALATRTAVDGPDDLPGVIAIQDAIGLEPLSAYLGAPAAAAAPEIAFPAFTPEVDGSPLLLECLNLLLAWHTLPRFETGLMARLAKIGVGAHRTFALQAFAPSLGGRGWLISTQIWPPPSVTRARSTDAKSVIRSEYGGRRPRGRAGWVPGLMVEAAGRRAPAASGLTRG